jgi:hypothetical protein
MPSDLIWIAVAIFAAGSLTAAAIDSLRKTLQFELRRLHARFCKFAFESDYGGSSTVTEHSQLHRLVRQFEFHYQWMRNTSRVED